MNCSQYTNIIILNLNIILIILLFSLELLTRFISLSYYDITLIAANKCIIILLIYYNMKFLHFKMCVRIILNNISKVISYFRNKFDITDRVM